jgi:hypothetical protein
MSHNQNINDQKLFYVFNKTTVSDIIALSLLNCNDLMHCSILACHEIYVYSCPQIGDKLSCSLCD